MGTTIFLDESGYTGDDLLDSAQPAFVVATHRLTENECRALKGEYFGALGASELKHGVLQRRGNHQKSVVRLVADVVARPAALRVAVVHKRFALTLKVVDFLVEPLAHRFGLDIYRTGFFRSLGNLLFFALQAEGSITLGELLRTFQDLVRRRTSVAFNEFLRVVNRPALAYQIDEVLDIVRVHANQTTLSDIAALPPRSLDVSLTMALQCLFAWRSMNVGPMDVVHDQSSNMARQKDLWDVIVSPRAPEAFVGYGVEGIQFPLGVAGTTFVDSLDSPGVQIADVLAGAVCRWARWMMGGRPASDAYGTSLDAVLDASDKAFLATLMWPTLDVERDDTPPEIGNLLDYLVERAGEVAPRTTSGVQSTGEPA